MRARQHGCKSRGEDKRGRERRGGSVDSLLDFIWGIFASSSQIAAFPGLLLREHAISFENLRKTTTTFTNVT